MRGSGRNGGSLMEFREVVRRRRMVRSYRDRPVDRAVVERVVALARRAPSAGFAQGQRFVVVTDRRTREAVADLAGEDRYVARGFDPWLSRAPVHVAVCADERAYRARYQQADKRDTGGPHWEVPYWLVDAGASLMLLLLAAVDEGLAAGLLGSHRMPGLAALLGIPPGVHPVGVVTLGHPAPDRRSGSLARGWQDLGEAVHWERWGGG